MLEKLLQYLAEDFGSDFLLMQWMSTDWKSPGSLVQNEINTEQSNKHPTDNHSFAAGCQHSVCKHPLSRLTSPPAFPALKKQLNGLIKYHFHVLLFSVKPMSTKSDRIEPLW